MIETAEQQLLVTVDPLDIIDAGIAVLGGVAVQNYNKNINEYVPDRRVVPLVLFPYVKVRDPHGIMGLSDRPLTSVEWYDGVPSSNNRILQDDAKFFISESGVLTIKENTNPNLAKDIYAKFRFTDERTSQSVLVERNKTLRSTYYASDNYFITVDKPDFLEIDIVRQSSIVPLNAQLKLGSEKIADKNAVYWWYETKGGVETLIDSDNCLWMLTDKLENGTYPKTIQVDADYFDRVSIVARAAFKEDGAVTPTQPSDDEIQNTTTILRRYPKKLSTILVPLKTVRFVPNQNAPVSFRIEVRDNVGLITNPSESFEITWYKKAQNAASSTPFVIGYGETLTTTTDEIGLTTQIPYSVYAVLEENSFKRALSLNDKLLCVNGKVITI